MDNATIFKNLLIQQKMGWFMGNEPPRIEEGVKG
jgi:hypothetical protein